MNGFKNIAVLAMLTTLALASSRASADIIDFVTLTEGNNQLGESAWSALTIAGTGFNVDITGTKNGNSAYAYLDWNHAGLGVCGRATDTGAHPNSGRNRCDPASDDNVTTGEVLTFMFDADVIVDKIWFNNTHDPDFTIDFASGGDQISIGGALINAVGNGYATGNNYNNTINGASVSNYLGGFAVGANSAFNIGFVNEQFYISGMEVRARVPEPGTLALLGLGLAGLGLARRKRHAA